MFIERNVHHELAGFDFPSSMALSLNAFFILILGAVLTQVWLYLSRIDRSPILPKKFGVGIVLMGSGYLVICFAIAIMHHNLNISMWWIVFSYFLQTAGELFLSPTGLAMVGMVAPKKDEGFMLGVWNVMVGVGAEGFMIE